ncbi:hypothetical protein [Halalkalibacter krulwichiae]|uniref:Uncharacterized protein n=1 Tax=Halalkalibacter krulwichiae TaxID=199441 RepID=A0A1X9MCJ1_9BACI|nr:hypothetical protein [Halalkalibacter krulwichiae]ARK31126.1 hypothetical protein BkAM31D_15425 [Halalkalibacter krulwichiae]
MRWKLFFISFLLFNCISTNVYAGNEEFIDQIHIVPIQSTGIVNIDTQREGLDLEVDHDVKSGNVYVECFLNHFRFKEDKVGALHEEGEGHIRLYINDEHVDTLYQSAFIIEELPKGEYEIKIVVAQNDRSSYGLEKEFTVMIQ